MAPDMSRRQTHPPAAIRSPMRVASILGRACSFYAAISRRPLSGSRPMLAAFLNAPPAPRRDGRGVGFERRQGGDRGRISVSREARLTVRGPVGSGCGHRSLVAGGTEARRYPRSPLELWRGLGRRRVRWAQKARRCGGPGAATGPRHRHPRLRHQLRVGLSEWRTAHLPADRLPRHGRACDEAVAARRRPVERLRHVFSAIACLRPLRTTAPPLRGMSALRLSHILARPTSAPRPARSCVEQTCAAA